jgi:hypothetical protein
VFKIAAAKPEGWGGLICIWEGNICIDLNGIACKNMDCICLVHTRAQQQNIVNMEIILFHKNGAILEQ